LDFLTQGAVIEEDVRQALDVDCAPAVNVPSCWQLGTLSDGSPAEWPAKIRTQLQDDGSRAMLDAAGSVVASMPKGGHYYDPVYPVLAGAVTVSDVERHMDAIVNYDAPAYLDKSFEERAAEVKLERAATDYALVGYFGGHLLQAGQVLRGWEAFLVDLLVNQKIAHAILERLLQANLARFEQYAATIGQHVDIILFEEDLGMQDRPLLAPSVFRTMIKPYMQELLRFVSTKSDALILLHTDGAVATFIPDFIEMGVDAINPVQVSAQGMDPRALKQEFGGDIAFWGAGCDSQSVLPFGTPQEVEDEVKRRIDDLARGGGYVFAPIHNVLPGVPLDNVIAMFRTAREYGVTRGQGESGDPGDAP
jgi:uroporphyrinogen decarboxylase